MKKTIISAIMTLAVIVSYAQTNSESEHLVFKGVPIDGTLSAYSIKMQKAGFTHVQTKDGIAVLKGDFAGFKGCTVGVATQKQKDLVSKITVFFPEQKTWSTLFDNYSTLKEMLTEKYGEPSKTVEEFDGNTSPYDDNLKILQVGLDKCKYYSIFKTEKGNIELSISHDGLSSCFVTLAYYDKINTGKVREKAIDDL